MTFTVTICDNQYQPQIKVPNYESCSVTWQHLGIGSGTLIVDELDPAATRLRDCYRSVVPVIVEVNGRRWSGRAVNVSLERDGAVGTGTVTAALIDDWAWLRAMLASQNGANPSLTGRPVYDTRTGGTATVARQYIAAAASRLQVPVAVATAPSDSSAVITLNARMDLLSDLLTGPLSAANLRMPARLWVPGDPQPLGLSLNQPTVVFDPQPVADKPWLRWSDTVGGLSKLALQSVAPDAYSIILGLDGEDIDRRYAAYTNTASAADLGSYGFPEMYSDATDLDVTEDAQPRAQQKLAEKTGSVTASFTVTDGEPWSFATHYIEGDVASLQLFGLEVRQRISAVTATDNADGTEFIPQFGDLQVASSEEAIIRAVASIAQQMRTLQKGR